MNALETKLSSVLLKRMIIASAELFNVTERFWSKWNFTNKTPILI